MLTYFPKAKIIYKINDLETHNDLKDLNKKTDVIAEQSYSERQLFEKAYERLKSEINVVIGEKAQLKMDKALKRNLEREYIVPFKSSL